jgi:xanthine dehydrogenase small subunit
MQSSVQRSLEGVVMTDHSTVHSPGTIEEAFRLLDNRPHAITVIAGGTDLMVLMNARKLNAREFLDIWGVDELRGITDDGASLRIGSLTTYTQLIKSSLVQEYAPALVAASRTIGAVQIQNRGTIGGNIVNASPAGDSLPVLAAADAQIEVGSLRGKRQVPLNQFYTAYRQTVLQPDELVLKVGTRRAQAISKVVLSARARSMGGRLESVRIGVGSVAPTVIRARDTEALLSGRPLTPVLIEQARREIAQEVSPITDLRSTEHYRRAVTANVLARLLHQLGGAGAE